MVKAYYKNLRRPFFNNFFRLILVSLVIAIGICIMTALGGLPEKVRTSLLLMTTDYDQLLIIETVALKIEKISFIFPAFFIIVASLTAFLTISRYIDEERPNMACLKTLGYRQGSIICKYLIFAFACSLIGCIIGLLIGNYVLLPLLFDSVKAKFDLPDNNEVYFLQGIIWSLVMIATVVFVALFVALKSNKENPAKMLRPKVPKAGGKILLEKITFLWKPLKFKYKSTVRNIIRYKGRLIMTIVSVMGATALIFCGLGLYASLNTLQNESINNFEALAESISPISIAIIFCASLLAILVIFNLTFINVEERKREIATLKVLGYKKLEVASFIYREVFILSVFGIIVGLPSGYLLLGYMFDYLEFGSIEHIKANVWLFSVVISLFSVLLADILLYHKIDKIEMHSSLKAIE